MKTVVFKKIQLTEKEKNPEVTVRDVLALLDRGPSVLRERLNDIIENAKESTFSYREYLQDHMRSQKWNSEHPLTDLEKMDTAIAVRKVLNAEEDELEVDKAVADYLCDLAGSIPFNPAADLETLLAIRGFMEYFQSLRKAEDKAHSKDEGDDAPEKEEKEA